jgi:hypothetical protein
MPYVPKMFGVSGSCLNWPIVTRAHASRHGPRLRDRWAMPTTDSHFKPAIRTTSIYGAVGIVVTDIEVPNMVDNLV